MCKFISNYLLRLYFKFNDGNDSCSERLIAKNYTVIVEPFRYHSINNLLLKIILLIAKI